MPAAATVSGRPGRVARVFCSAVDGRVFGVVVARGGLKVGVDVGAGVVVRGGTLLEDEDVLDAAASGVTCDGAVRVGAGSGAGSGAGAFGDSLEVG